MTIAVGSSLARSVQLVRANVKRLCTSSDQPDERVADVRRRPTLYGLPHAVLDQHRRSITVHGSTLGAPCCSIGQSGLDGQTAGAAVLTINSPGQFLNYRPYIAALEILVIVLRSAIIGPGTIMQLRGQVLCNGTRTNPHTSSPIGHACSNSRQVGIDRPRKRIPDTTVSRRGCAPGHLAVYTTCSNAWATKEWGVKATSRSSRPSRNDKRAKSGSTANRTRVMTFF